MKKLKSTKAFIDYLQIIEDGHENLEKYNPYEENKC